MHSTDDISAVTDRTKVWYEEGLIPDYFISPAIRVQEIEGKGLGIIAIADIEPNEIIECCPMKLLTPDKHLDRNWARLHRLMMETVLSDYIFEWSSKHGAVALGYGGLYNHSAHPNATNIRLIKQKKMVIVAQQPIQPGTEVTISYRMIWFKPIDDDPPRVGGK